VSSSRTPAGKKKGPAGSLAWASDRAGPLGPAQKIKKIKKKIESVEIKNFACLRKNIFLSTYSMISGS